jgi:hypothetical protein
VLRLGPEHLAIAHDIPTDTIARELHLPLEEVNKAALAAIYEDYIKH